MPLIMIHYGPEISIARYFDVIPRVGDVLIIGAGGEQTELRVDRAQHAQRGDGTTMDFSIHAYSVARERAGLQAGEAAEGIRQEPGSPS